MQGLRPRIPAIDTAHDRHRMAVRYTIGEAGHLSLFSINHQQDFPVGEGTTKFVEVRVGLRAGKVAAKTALQGSNREVRPCRMARVNEAPQGEIVIPEQLFNATPRFMLMAYRGVGQSREWNPPIRCGVHVCFPEPVGRKLVDYRECVRTDRGQEMHSSAPAVTQANC